MSRDASEIDDEHGTDAGPKVRLLTLDQLDGRTAAARLVRVMIAALADDLGGIELLTEGKRQLVQRAAVLAVMIEDHEARWIGGEAFDARGYLAATKEQRLVLETLGLERLAKDVSPTLEQYLRNRQPLADSAA